MLVFLSPGAWSLGPGSLGPLTLRECPNRADTQDRKKMPTHKTGQKRRHIRQAKNADTQNRPKIDQKRRNNAKILRKKLKKSQNLHKFPLGGTTSGRATALSSSAPADHGF